MKHVFLLDECIVVKTIILVMFETAPTDTWVSLLHNELTFPMALSVHAATVVMWLLSYTEMEWHNWLTVTTNIWYENKDKSNFIIIRDYNACEWWEIITFVCKFGSYRKGKPCFQKCCSYIPCDPNCRKWNFHMKQTDSSPARCNKQ